ncbi:recombinase family protein [Rhodococcus opacus]|uniref:recombinase family protein n=1 Tax=Rhodococcus TaxID=1827 RepID=UPI0028701CCB|nr:recombinase family protein [Rhodococcus sp. UFZ-B548]
MSPAVSAPMSCCRGFAIRFGSCGSANGRVSTRDQNPESQRDALTAARCDEIFIDKASGKLARRPELDKALLSVTLPSDLPTAWSIGVLRQPRAIASLVYDMWLLNAAVGAVIESRDSAGLAAETKSLLTRRGLHVLADVVDLRSTSKTPSAVALG